MGLKEGAVLSMWTSYLFSEHETMDKVQKPSGVHYNAPVLELQVLYVVGLPVVACVSYSLLSPSVVCTWRKELAEDICSSEI